MCIVGVHMCVSVYICDVYVYLHLGYVFAFDIFACMCMVNLLSVYVCTWSVFASVMCSCALCVL